MNTSHKIKVFGHRSPDTDASCSAIVWAWFLNTHRNQNATPYILGPVNTEAEFVMESFGVTMPKILDTISDEDQVAIVDTNNLDELFENINDAEIISIIDHHKLTGTLKTNLPREIVIQPYASTMTVIYNVMNIEVKDLPRDIAGLMLSGIISDTLEFRSPTTTDEDRALAESLAKTIDITISDYAVKMFEAKSNISEFSAAELVRMDSKIYEINGKQTRVSVLETTNPKIVLDRYDEIIESYELIKEQDNVEQILLFAIDILKEEAIALIPDAETKSLITSGFNIDTDSHTVVLPGVVSRKKQILPALS
ncbi:MAG: manganese-dependent inorganic pyrophosphatase [Candidatus Pacebacteria bacterium]|nr:manganese-dependent inorganic pyrophosphatase [Candidatus Paceibacterota bacterium]